MIYEAVRGNSPRGYALGYCVIKLPQSLLTRCIAHVLNELINE